VKELVVVEDDRVVVVDDEVVCVVVVVLEVAVVVVSVVVLVVVVDVALQSQIGHTILLCVSFLQPEIVHGMSHIVLFVGKGMTQICCS
jgi:hypothetical protein